MINPDEDLFDWLERPRDLFKTKISIGDEVEQAPTNILDRGSEATPSTSTPQQQQPTEIAKKKSKKGKKKRRGSSKRRRGKGKRGRGKGKRGHRRGKKGHSSSRSGRSSSRSSSRSGRSSSRSSSRSGRSSSRSSSRSGRSSSSSSSRSRSRSRSKNNRHRRRSSSSSPASSVERKERRQQRRQRRAEKKAAAAAAPAPAPALAPVASSSSTPSSVKTKQKRSQEEKLRKSQQKFANHPSNEKYQRKLNKRTNKQILRNQARDRNYERQQQQQQYQDDLQRTYPEQHQALSQTYARQSYIPPPPPPLLPRTRTSAYTSLRASPAIYQDPYYYQSMPQQQQPSPIVVVNRPTQPIAVLAPTPVISPSTAVLASQTLNAPMPIQPTIVSAVSNSPNFGTAEGKREVLSQMGSADIPKVAIDQLVANTSTEDIEKLWRTRQHFIDVRDRHGGDPDNPDVQDALADYKAQRQKVVNSVKGGVAVMHIVEENGALGSNPQAVRDFARKFANRSNKTRNAFFKVANEHIDDPQHPELTRAIQTLNEEMKNTRIGCHTQQHTEAFYPIPSYSAASGLVEAFVHYDILMAQMASSVKEKLAHVNDIPQYTNIMNTIGDIRDVLSQLSPYGCHFPDHFTQLLIQLTILKMVNAINQNSALNGSIRTINTLIVDYIREIKTPALADLWASSSTDHTDFAMALLKMIVDNYTPEVTSYLSRCIDNPSPLNDLAFSIFLTIPKSSDPNGYVNIYVTEHSHAVLYPEQMSDVKAELSNLNLYINSVEIPKKKLTKFTKLIRELAPKISSHKFDASAPQIRLQSGLIITKSPTPPFTSPEDRKHWTKLWKLYDSFIKSFKKK